MSETENEMEHARRRVIVDLREDVARALLAYLDRDYVPHESRPALVAIESALRRVDAPRVALQAGYADDASGASTSASSEAEAR